MNPFKAFLLLWISSIQVVACLSESHADRHRKLQQLSAYPTMAPSQGPSFTEEFQVPFQVVWNMAFSDETAIREPTEDELSGMFYATLKWILASAREYYADQRNVLALDHIDFTHYGTIFNETDAYPFSVGMECACYFHANNESVVPSVFDFLVTFSSNFNRTLFLDEYLSNADPADSIFHNVAQLRYNIIPSDLDTSGIKIITLTIKTEWRYEIGFGIPDRVPTDQDYQELDRAMNDWMSDVFLEAYPPNSNGLPEFHMLENTVYSRTFDFNQTQTHIIQQMTDVSLRVANATSPLTVIPDDLLNILIAADLSEYMHQYVHPASEATMGLFFGVVSIAWSSLGIGVWFSPRTG